LSAAGTEEGEYRVIQDNPSKAPRRKAELYKVSRFCLPLVQRKVSTVLYKATPARLLDKAGLSGESVSSATTEGGKNRSVQGNPGRAPRIKTKLQVEKNNKP
jgi:hypothetical protein